MKPLYIFLDDLLALESGILIDKFEWYCKNYNTKCIDYYEVVKPGVIKRDLATGKPLLKVLTVKEYFLTLDVEHLFNLNDSASIKNMQYHSINALGFIGYQFGEALLYDLGFYIPPKQKYNDQLLDSFYVGGVSDKVWSNGNKSNCFYVDSLHRNILATHVNFWNGKFCGLTGLNYFDDLRTPHIQNKIIVEAFQYNIKVLKNLFRISKGEDILIKLKDTRSDSVLFNLYEMYGEGILSGIIAAMHLCGPYGFYELYKKNIVNYDEFSTPITNYIKNFSNYDVSDFYKFS